MAIPLTTMTGRLVAPPELRFTASGTAVANFRMAENDNKYNEDTREWETTSTLFLTVNAWERLAERVAGSLDKGDSVVVTGKLQTREWEDKQGNRRSTIEMTARDIKQTQALQATNDGGHGNGGGGGGWNNTGGGAPAANNAASSDPWGSAPAATGGFGGAANDDEPPF